ncbi:MAG: hypothetical protein ABEJ04_08030 [Halobacteriaceae archaeon]
MTVAVDAVETYVRDLELRIPFSFGVTTLTAVPHGVVRLEATVDGASSVGVAAENLVPKWFTKDPDTPVEEDVTGLLEVVERAASAVRAAGTEPTAFDLWRRTYARQREWAAGTDHPPLLWGFGVSLVERAVVDAVCRATGTPFHEAVRDGTLGVDPGAVHGELAGADPTALLPDAPRETVHVRHTVGYTDPLTRADADSVPADGLPRTLAEVVDAYGVRYFKLKLSGDVGADADRLRRVVDVLDGRVRDPAFTLDANEQYGSVSALRELWEAVASDDALTDLEDGLLFVEQPFDREVALSADVGEALRAWEAGPPVIIDESDATLDSLPTALERGYAGTSHKNCKGVFKGLCNACLLERRRRETGADPILSGEDLSTVGPVSLQQDLAAMATLGVGHVERNGHHYFRGLAALPEAAREATLAAHGDLYRRHEEGFPTLDVEEGRVALGSALDAPFGVDESLPTDPETLGCVPLEEWSFEA